MQNIKKTIPGPPCTYAHSCFLTHYVLLFCISPSLSSSQTHTHPPTHTLSISLTHTHTHTHTHTPTHTHTHRAPSFQSCMLASFCLFFLQDESCAQGST